ncbi:hypothetical protein D3C84_1224780 [compost metagenome]
MGLALIALHTGAFFGVLAPPAKSRPANPMQNTVYHFLGEKLQAPGAGVSFGDEIIIETQGRAPERK